ncbi:hypothetical protein V8E53_011917 [Lactarius tabidus]|jgi:hypothetical protein
MAGRLVSFLFLFPVLCLSLSLDPLTLAFLSLRFVAVETVINILPAPCPSRGQQGRFPCRSIRVPFPSWAEALPQPDLLDTRALDAILHSDPSIRLLLLGSLNQHSALQFPATQSIPADLQILHPLCPRPRGNCQTSLMLISQIPLGTLRCQYSAHPTVSPRPNRSILSTFHPRLYSS